MLKTISAALLAVSALAAPAFAATSGQTAPVVKVAATRTRVLNAHAGMDRHHVSHHRHHHKMGALGKHHISKVAIKHAAAVKRS